MTDDDEAANSEFDRRSYLEVMRKLKAAEALHRDEDGAYRAWLRCTSSGPGALYAFFYGVPYANLTIRLCSAPPLRDTRENAAWLTLSICTPDSSAVTLHGPIETYLEAGGRQARVIEMVHTWGGQVPTQSELEQVAKRCGLGVVLE